MILWKRAFLLGLLSWAIPFAISFAAFPLKRVNAPLFESVMTLVLVMTAGVLLRSYCRGRGVAAGEAVVVGALWLAVNLVFDYPMFAYGPMKMTAAKYYSEIGVDYLIFPAFALASSRLAPKDARA
jgi:hypothetical protein